MKYGRIEKPLVTAIIPVYNEEKALAACLASLRAQDFPSLDIIVVDDGSSDSSIALCRGLGVAVIEQKHRGPGAARNLGAAAAAGNILLFADADMTFSADYVSKLAAPIISGKTAGTTHWDEVVANWENPWARAQTWFLGCPDRRRHLDSDAAETTVYRAVRKDFFIVSGGFSENEGRADDASLARKSGRLPEVVRGAVCYHRNVEDLRDAFLEARWRGRDAASSLKSLKDFASVVLVHRNPLRDLLAALRIFRARREVQIFPFAAVFSIGFQCGLFSAYFKGNYLK